MSSTAVLGCAWGDEAKAKIVDVLAPEYEIILRFQGGNNAGHTISLAGEKYIFHLVPSGILYPEKICILAAGVVIDPFQLIDEMESLKERGIRFKDRFFVSPRANLVLPIHRKLDATQEAKTDSNRIGTTKRGIGPCYSDLSARLGIRCGDLFQAEYLKQRLINLFKFHHQKPKEIKKLMKKLIEVRDYLQPFIRQIPYYLANTHQKNILYEGAQGALLDIFYGTFPFVTSSHTITGGIHIGRGFPQDKDLKIYGVFKSYYTRVGEGPFPTELKDETGDKIRTRGNEFGSTTGRPRRCGWFDGVAAKYATMLNGINKVALTLLDVLSGFEEIKICTSYQINSEISSEFPDNPVTLVSVIPVYEKLPGWDEDITKVKKFHELPPNARNYVRKIEEILETKVAIISVGPDRNQTIFREELNK